MFHLSRFEHYETRNQMRKATEPLRIGDEFMFDADEVRDEGTRVLKRAQTRTHIIGRELREMREST